MTWTIMNTELEQLIELERVSPSVPPANPYRQPWTIPLIVMLYDDDEIKNK